MMDIRNIKKIPSSLRNRDGWVKMFESKLSAEPHLHQIEPTNHCPYSCLICPRSYKMNRILGFMNTCLFEKVIAEVGTYSPQTKTKEIELFHFGESLLHPEIAEMVGYVSGNGLKGVLSVNAPEMFPELMRRVLTNKPYKIIISLDGYDNESYKRIRGENADFVLAVRNIIELISIHKELKSETILTVRMIEFSLNDQHVEEFRKFWADKEIGVEIREFFPWSEKEMISLGKFKKFPPFMPCPFPWQYLVVQWDGSVVACCRDYNSENILGNAKEQTLLEIWNGEKLKILREKLKNADYRNLDNCHECMEIYYTE